MKKNTTTDSKDFSQLHDIWALTSIESTTYEIGDSPKYPTLEINLSENKVFGNDVCNRFFSGIDSVGYEVLHLGMLAGTKMICQNMEVADSFGKLLSATRRYKLQELQLTLMDDEGKELLTFKKVD